MNKVGFHINAHGWLPCLLPLVHVQARDIQSGEMMAVKVYNLPALGELNKVQLIREIRLHGSFSHRNIIELYVAFQVRRPCSCASNEARMR